MTVTFPSEWQPYILAALMQLTLQATWQGDQAAVIDAQGRAYAIIQTMQQASCDIPPFGVGMEVETEMGLRVDCDCRVFVTCCDGTEVELLTTKHPGAPVAGQPGTGSNQAPPGGSATNCYSLGAKASLALAQTVNSGDTLRFESLLGSWYDTTYLNILKCPDGWFYINGACFQDVATIGTDPVTTVPHMALVVEIDGTFYDPLNLDAFGNPQDWVVPAGHSNSVVHVQANNSTLNTGEGDVTFCVKYINNATPTWARDFDYTTAPLGFLPCDSVSIPGPRASWVAGSGWDSVYNVGGLNNTEDYIYNLKKPTLTKVGLSGVDNGVAIWNFFDGGQFTGSMFANGTTPGTGAFTETWTGSQVISTGLRLQLAILGANLPVKITHLHLEGTGVDPY